jgi:hypothetical protein
MTLAMKYGEKLAATMAGQKAWNVHATDGLSFH